MIINTKEIRELFCKKSIVITGNNDIAVPFPSKRSLARKMIIAIIMLITVGNNLTKIMVKKPYDRLAIKQ